MTTRWLMVVGMMVVAMALALTPGLQAQDGLRSASLPERPIATLPPGPEDLFRATPNTYRPRNRPLQPLPPHDGRGAGPVRPEHPISGLGGSRRWPTSGWGYWPYYPAPLDPSPARVERESPAGGRLQLRVAPGDARVYINGQYEGRADDLREPGALLKPGIHRVRLEANGYLSHTFDVRIDEGGTATGRATLDPETASATGTARAEPKPGQAHTVRPAPQDVKTMYVIPRCYAGDRPPDPATHCDLTQLRTIR